jgi:hypothetical protein
MKTMLFATTILTLALGATSAGAQTMNIKPGLWQLEVTMPGADNKPMAGYIAQMKARMAAMPPAQRKEMEAALAGLEARGTEVTDNGLRTKQCITKENIAQYDLLGTNQAKGCTNKAAPKPGGVNVSMTCQRPQMTIEAAVTFQGEKAYAFESLATVPGPDGKMVTQKSSGTGQWLASDCGRVQPAPGRG